MSPFSNLVYVTPTTHPDLENRSLPPSGPWVLSLDSYTKEARGEYWYMVKTPSF